MAKQPLNEARASVSVPQQTTQARSAFEIELARAEAARQEVQRQLMANVQALLARVAELEASLNRLQTCTVQQFADGRLYYPAGDRFRMEVEIPGAFGAKYYEYLDMGRFRADPTRPLSAGPPRPCGQLMPTVPAIRLPVPPPSGTPGSAGALQAAQAAGMDWRAIAGANGIENPLIRKP